MDEDQEREREHLGDQEMADYRPGPAIAISWAEIADPGPPLFSAVAGRKPGAGGAHGSR